MQWNNLTQGNRIVAEYVQEWERLLLLCDVHETEDIRINKFVVGLREDLVEKMLSTSNLTFPEVCNLAINYEKFSNRMKASQSTPSYNRNPRAQPFKTPNKTPNTHRRKEPDNREKGKNKEDLPLKTYCAISVMGGGIIKILVLILEISPCKNGEKSTRITVLESC